MMRASKLVWCVVVCCVVPHASLLLVGVAGLPADGVLSSTILTGSVFSIPNVNRTSLDAESRRILLVTNQTDGSGALLNAPELQVVANTTVYFNLTAVWAPDTVVDSVSFGLTRSPVTSAPNVHPVDADPLGLTPTSASIAAGSCTTVSDASPPTNYIEVNSWGLNWTVTNGAQVFSTTPCIVQWLVPPFNASVNATQYYYFNPANPTAPRRIYIVDGASPTTPSPSGSGTGSGSGSGSGSNNNNTTTTSPPTTAAPSGTSSLSPTSPSSSSSTGAKSSSPRSFRASVWVALVAVLAIVSAVSAC